jgi:hypothetical protein
VIVDSKFEGAADVSAAYLGNGTGVSETVLIDCMIGPVLRPEGWNSRGANDAEFGTKNLGDGKPYDMSKWPAFVKHFDKEKDAATIANYRDPAWVLGGWVPAVAPMVLAQPAGASVAAGQELKLTAAVAAVPAGKYQWQRNGAEVKDGNGVTGASTDTLVVEKVKASDAGSYTVMVSNSAGTAKSEAAVVAVK